MRRRDVMALVGAVVALTPAAAQAAPSCEARGPFGTVLGQPAGAPPATNAGAAGCRADAADGGVRVRSAPDLAVPLPVDQVADRIGILRVPLPEAVAEVLGPLPPLGVGGGNGDGGPTGAVGETTGDLGGAVDETADGIGDVVDGIGGVLDGVTGGSGSDDGGGGGLLGNLPIVGDLPLGGSGDAGGGGPIGGLFGRRATARQAPGSTLSVDLRPALAAALPDGRLPETELVAVEAIDAVAGVRCADGRARLDADVRVTGLAVLGTPVPVPPADQAKQLTAPVVIDPSRLDLGLVRLPAGLSLSDPVTGPLLAGALRAALDALPVIELPATTARVVVTPGTRERRDGALVAEGPRVQATIAGRPVADVTLGQAVARDGGCATANGGGAGVGGGAASGTGGAGGGVTGDAASGSAAGSAASACTPRRVVVTDVRRRGARLRVAGLAPASLAGRRVALRVAGRRVARSAVRADGSFAVRKRLPRAVRRAKRAPLRAVVGGRRSRAVALHTRARLRTARAAGRRVVLAGRIAGPRGKHARVAVLRQGPCAARATVVKRAKLRRGGRFRVRVRVPVSRPVAVYRVRARVLRRPKARATTQVSTLPRMVRMR